MSIFKLCAFADEADSTMTGQIKALHENDIDLLEIRGVDEKNITELTLSEMKELRTRLDGEGIKIWSIGSPIGKIEMEDDFEKHLEVFRHTLELANIAGAERMRIFSFFMKAEDAPKYKNEVIDRLGRFLDIAKGSGVLLCHENEKDIYGDIPERCVDIHKALPELPAIFDPANFVQCGVDTLKAWDMLKDYVDYMHIKDAIADGTVVPAGKGLGNVPAIVKDYLARGGSVMTLEPHLNAFTGLDKLEDGESLKKGFTVYKNNEESFDAAVSALKDILVNI